MKKSKLFTAVLAGSLTFSSTTFAGHGGHVGLVINGNDNGWGSLRAALEAGKSKIVIKPRVKTISILSSLEYTGEAPLKIIGTGQTITGDVGEAPLFQVSNGANLSIKKLDFVGVGEYSIENQGGGKGIFVNVPEDRQGTVRVKLSDVTVRNTGNHGIHISDCTIGDACGGGQGGAGDGSEASIAVRLNNVLIDSAGIGKQDADGLRVDDRGAGDIYFSANNSVFVDVGGDGIELDEGNEGSVYINVRNSTFLDNGVYCSADFVADPIALDPSCDDDGDPDVDDAFDIDEAGPGGIGGVVNNVELINNYDEGLDFDSEGTGDDNFVDLEITNIFARDNDDEAIKVSEEEDASVVVRMRGLDIGGDVEVEEEGDGDLEVVIKASTIGDDLKLAESDEGVGTVKLRAVTIADEKDFDNVDEI